MTSQSDPVLWKQLGLPVAIVIVVALLLAQLPAWLKTPVSPETSTGNEINSVGIEMVPLPGGRFTMGGTLAAEQPHRVVTVAPFLLGKYEVTQAQWAAVMGYNPGFPKGPRYPVNQVTWVEVQEFISRLNQKENTTAYRLPSEAEWEYAARAGTASLYGFGDDANQLARHAWFGSDTNTGARPVGQLTANSWGLYDMHGNVWEWVRDCWHDNYEGAPADARPWLEGGDCSVRVLRGGAWNSAAAYLRSAARGSYRLDLDDMGNGFRLARSLQEESD